MMPAWAGEPGASSLNLLAQTSILSEFVRMEPGTFLHGSINPEAGRKHDEAIHQAQITHPYLIGRTEVTKHQMLKTLQSRLEREAFVIGTRKTFFMPVEGSRHWTLANYLHSDHTVVEGHLAVELGMEDNPCTGVTWFGAIAHANLRSLNDHHSLTIDLTDLSSDLSASGFRLPTKHEWEYTRRSPDADES